MNTIRLIVSILLVIIVLDLLCVKSRFLNFSNIQTSTFFEIKKFQNFVDVTAILAVFDDSDFSIFSALHTDTVDFTYNDNLSIGHKNNYNTL